MEFIKENKGIKAIIILFICFIVLGGLNLIIKNKNNKNKVLEGSDYVYSKNFKLDNGVLPVINIDGEEIEKVNKEIEKKYFEVCSSNYITYKYSYNIKNDILSLLITIIEDDGSDLGDYTYYSYNIDIKKSKVLSNNELLDKIGISKDTIFNSMTSKFKNYYQDSKITDSYEVYLDSLNVDLNNGYFNYYIDEDELKVYYVYHINYDISINSDNGFPYEFAIEKID